MCWFGKGERRIVGFHVFGRGFLWPFGGVLGRKGTVGLLRIKPHPIKISSSTFRDYCIVGVLFLTMGKF